MCAKKNAMSKIKVDKDIIYKYINGLANPDTREKALLDLSKYHDMFSDLAPMLWNSAGTAAALLQEVIGLFAAFNPANLTDHQSNRACCTLALWQCLAAHKETRSLFIQAQFPIYLYPFFNITLNETFEHPRLAALAVIGALVNSDQPDVVMFLLTTEFVPLCLKMMDAGTVSTKTIATTILRKILLDEFGLTYVCQTYERFSHVATVLGRLVKETSKDPNSRLLQHVIRCYLRLSDNNRAQEALRQCLPEELRDPHLITLLGNDQSTENCLSLLIKNLKLSKANAVVAK